jgi:hypothetical protein
MAVIEWGDSLKIGKSSSKERLKFRRHAPCVEGDAYDKDYGTDIAGMIGRDRRKNYGEDENPDRL